MNYAQQSIEQFARKIELARKSVMTPTEVIYSFLESVLSHTELTDSFYRLLPEDLANEINSWVGLSPDQWNQKVTCHDATTLQDHLQCFLKQYASTISNAPPLNYQSPAKNTKACPYCGKPLRTTAAKQCRFCKTDRHKADNIPRK